MHTWWPSISARPGMAPVASLLDRLISVSVGGAPSGLNQPATPTTVVKSPDKPLECIVVYHLKRVQYGDFQLLMVMVLTN